MTVEVHAEFFQEKMHFFSSWVLFAFENHYLSALVTLFQPFGSVVTFLRKPFGEAGETSTAWARALPWLMAFAAACRHRVETKS